MKLPIVTCLHCGQDIPMKEGKRPVCSCDAATIIEAQSREIRRLRELLKR